ncbi:MAG: Methyltransferase type 11 [Solirubrobacterales bacterium]|nr:Methyltransferase type 11 [Solirubrobacterales bacterium]
MAATPFPPGFFDRLDPSPDTGFYGPPRLVHHLDDGAIQAVGELYEELGVDRGRVLDLMSSWVSHFLVPPEALVILGMNADELRANTAAAERVVHDLNAVPELPFDAGTFDHAVCCVSVDYLTRPLEVFAEIAQVLKPGGLFVCTFSNRCFPTKAIRGWLASDDAEHVRIVRSYFAHAGGFGPADADLRTDPHAAGDPLWAVWARARS